MGKLQRYFTRNNPSVGCASSGLVIVGLGGIPSTNDGDPLAATTHQSRDINSSLGVSQETPMALLLYRRYARSSEKSSHFLDHEVFKLKKVLFQSSTKIPTTFFYQTLQLVKPSKCNQISSILLRLLSPSLNRLSSSSVQHSCLTQCGSIKSIISKPNSHT